MAKEFGSGRNFTFLRLNSKGELYESAKEEKEGFVKVELKNNKVTYQKAYKSTDYGKVVFLGIKDKAFDTGTVQYLEISIQSDESENAVDVIQLPLLNQQGGLTDEVKKLIAVLPSLDYTKSVIVSSNRDKNDRGYVDKILYFRYKSVDEGEKDQTIKFSLRFGEKGNVPMFLVKQNPINPEKKTLNYDDQDAFLSMVLKYELKRFEDFIKAGEIYVSEHYKDWGTSEEVAETVTETKPEADKTAKTKVEENPFAANAVGTDDESPF